MSAWSGRRVLVTGHTGFKGSWLVLMLDALGAQVHGLALPPPTTPSLFELARVQRRLASDLRGDISVPGTYAEALRRARPELIFHLAAQALVRESYARPVETFAVNVMGTAYTLEAARAAGCPVVVVTSDKCYAPVPGDAPHREGDAMGGHDPYSASKGAAELTADVWQRAFGVRVVRVRAGNVVGGGDWAADRLIPDVVRATVSGQPVRIRQPGAVRPWQYVLDPLRGYVLAGERLLTGVPVPPALNFGPDDTGEATVLDVVERVARAWPAVRVEVAARPEDPAERGVLRLDSTLARTSLGWAPRCDLGETLERTAAWYRAWAEGEDVEGRTVGEVERG